MQQPPGVALEAELVLLPWQGQLALQYASCCHRPPLPLQCYLMLQRQQASRPALLRCRLNHSHTQSITSMPVPVRGTPALPP